MHMSVTKWGNSLGVRIPRILAHKIGIHEGTPVDISIRGRHIVISKEYSLKLLLDQITEENIHKEVSSEPSCGEESW